MAIEFKTNLFDISKFIGVGLLIAFVFFNYGKFTSWIGRPKIDPSLIPRIVQLEKGLTRVTGQANTQELKRLIADLRKEQSIALAAIKKANEKVDQVTKIVTELKASSKIQEGDTFKDPEKVTRNFSDTIVTRPADKGGELPMARVFFHPEIPEKPWTIQNFPLKLHTNVLQTQTEDGTYSNYVETYFTNDFVKSSKGKKYYFNSYVEWAKREIKYKKFRFNLRLGFTGGAAQDSVFPGLDLSFASYGKTKRDMDWRFLTFGVGFAEEDVYGYFMPVQYNIGNFIPFVENMFIGPFIGVGTDTDIIYGVGLSVPF